MPAGQPYHAIMDAPFGRLGVRVGAGRVAAIDLLERPARAAGTEPLAAEVCRQLSRYFADPHFRFDLPLSDAGTPFQREVWRQMREIPVGETVTYGELARRVASGARAIGGACHANPIPVVVPCHRVVAASGPGGYMGSTRGRGMRMKHWLLEHERAR